MNHGMDPFLVLRAVAVPEQAIDMQDRFEGSRVELSIGRAGHCDWVLPGRGVSRLHAVIRRLNGRYMIEDRSANGTWLNGMRLVPGEPGLLAPGDRLRIDAFDIVVGDDDEPSTGQIDLPLPLVRRQALADLIVGSDDKVDDAPSVAGGAGWLVDGLSANRTVALNIERGRRAFDALLARFDPAAFVMDPDCRKRHGLRGDGGAWGRYCLHFQRVVAERDRHFQALLDELRAGMNEFDTRKEP